MTHDEKDTVSHLDFTEYFTIDSQTINVMQQQNQKPNLG